MIRTRPNRAELDATKVPTAHDIAWAAGLYEGEGSCRLCGRGKRSLSVGIPQKDPELLYWLRDWFGGSVGNPSGGNPCHHWDICGDRGRLFLAQIYSRLTARRKSQIDATNCLDFMGSTSLENVTVETVKNKLLGYYEAHRETTEENPEVRRANHSRSYHSAMENDPEFREYIRERSQRQRDNMTPEQREAARKYQQAYYQNKKQKGQVLSISKIA